MSEVQEAIKVLEYNLEHSDDSIFEDASEAIKTEYLALQLTITQALKLLESEPEPGEWTAKVRETFKYATSLSAEELFVACDRIDRLEAENKENKFLLEHGTAALLKTKDARIKELEGEKVRG